MDTLTMSILHLNFMTRSEPYKVQTQYTMCTKMLHFKHVEGALIQIKQAMYHVIRLNLKLNVGINSVNLNSSTFCVSNELLLGWPEHNGYTEQGEGHLPNPVKPGKHFRRQVTSDSLLPCWAIPVTPIVAISSSNHIPPSGNKIVTKCHGHYTSN